MINALKLGLSQTVAAGASSSVAPKEINYVRVNCVVDSVIKIGSLDTGLGSNVPANYIEYFQISPGETVDVISGDVQVTWVYK